MQKLEAHPDAAIFPMMSPDELADLAEDIKANGLKHPIVKGQHEGREVIVDGRNRQDACEMAGVKPTYVTLNGEDVKAFIISNNVKRRHLNSGQRAMSVAMMWPEPTEAEKRHLGGISSVTEGISSGRLSMARTVLRALPADAEKIMAGKKFLDAVYPEARAKLKAMETEDEQLDTLRAEAPDLRTLVDDSRITLDAALNLLKTRKEDQAKLVEVREQAPDLITLVDDGRMSVQDALVAFAKRKEDEQNRRRGTTALFASAARLFAVAHVNPEQEATRLMKDFDPLLWPADELGVPNHQLFDALATVLTTCAKIRKEQEKRK